MRVFRTVLPALLICLFITAAYGGDFDFLRSMNVRAEADLPGFRADLSVRFNVPETRVDFIMRSVDRPADAYMVLRVGQLAQQPVETVLTEYSGNKGKGWGVIAKRLGIKPGSREFHELKRGDDFGDGPGNGNGHGKRKGHNK